MDYKTQPRNTSDFLGSMQECYTWLSVRCKGFDGSDMSPAVSDTRWGKKSPITLEESRHKRKLHCLNLYSRILCWILLFDNILSHASSTILYIYSSYIFTHPTVHIYLHPPKSISKNSKPAKEVCLHFLNLFLTV